MEDIQNEIMKTILHRRAIRRFEEKQIEETELQQILQAGLYAPSAGGRQGVLFVVCQDQKVNEWLGKIGSCYIGVGSGGMLCFQK